METVINGTLEPAAATSTAAVVPSRLSRITAHPATRVSALVLSHLTVAVAGWWLGKKVERSFIEHKVKKEAAKVQTNGQEQRPHAQA